MSREKIILVFQSKLLQLYLLSTLLIAFIFLNNPVLAHANYSAASWWNGDQCDSTHYTSINTGDTPVLFTTWNGIQACGYGLNQTPSWSDVNELMPGSQSTENEWECTELVKRYLFIAYDAPALGSTNGDQVVANYAGANHFQ